MCNAVTRTAAFLAGILAAGEAGAELYRLQGDALLDAHDPAGFVFLRGEARPRTWIGAEAVVWTGADGARDGVEPAGDALVAAVRLRDPGGLGDVRAGRFVLTTGAVRPVHVDGVHARGRLPAGLGVEAFGGLPVVPELDVSLDRWIAGGRVSETIGSLLVVGASYVHERDDGNLADEEVGGDLAFFPARWLDVAARVSYDLVQPGPSEVQGSAATRAGPFRLEAFGTRRSPSRILPATSIFAALGDVPSDRLGATGTWFAAPRLDLRASASSAWAGGETGVEASLAATLRLDDEGAGAVALEGRRATLVSPWTGARVALRVPLVARLHAATELELVVPDDSHGRGDAWPWGLVGLGWEIGDHWDLATAVEGAVSPEHRREVTGLARLTYRWEAR